MDAQSAVSASAYTITWRNPEVRDCINKNFPGEWEKDIAFFALALVSRLNPRIADLLGADMEG